MTLYSAETPLDESQDIIDVDMGDTWLSLARDAHEQSQSFFDSSVRKKIEDALSHFNNKHVSGSKYNSNAYKYRSKSFRPKTRSVVRKNEAAAAKALFSTQDVVHVSAENEADINERISAEINHTLVNYRLDNSINWLKTALGAYQNTLVEGVCISHQSWDFEEVYYTVPQLDQSGSPFLNELGETVMTQEIKVIRDKPKIDLRPIENVLFSAAADWVDPINTSPFIIDKLPMYIGDVKARMQGTYDKNGQVWYQLDDEQLKQGISDENTTQAVRDGKREDAKDQNYVNSDFDTVWVHRNIIRRDGRDWIYYTLGTHFMLSEPKLLTEEYIHLSDGQRPYVLGQSMIEAHKNYPDSVSTLTTGLQQEANDINNQRRDNVALVLNKRYYIRRGSGIDYKALSRNIPGSAVTMTDINADIRTESPPEVTGSSYQEQDRVNMDYDELAGSFSNSSISSNRQLNETVGGMSMLKDDSNEMSEYQLRIFVDTWVVPVIKQLIQLEQAYETDEAILNLIAEKAELWQRYGIAEITDQMLQGSMTVRVNVGFGATNPQKRIEKLTLGFRTIAEVTPQVIQQIDAKEVVTEVMGALGFRGVERFFPSLKEEQQDPQLQQLQQQVQELQAQLQGRQLEAQSRIQQAQIKAESELQREAIRNEGKAMEVAIKSQIERQKLDYEREIAMIDRQLQHEKNEHERGKLINARDALLFKMREETQNIMDQESDLLTNPDNRQSKVIMNDKYQMIPMQRG